MSSYFVNSTFPVTLASGQESFLGQLPLYSSGYADPLRHYPAPSGPGPGPGPALFPGLAYQAWPGDTLTQTLTRSKLKVIRGTRVHLLLQPQGGAAPTEYSLVWSWSRAPDAASIPDSRWNLGLQHNTTHEGLATLDGLPCAIPGLATASCRILGERELNSHTSTDPKPTWTFLSFQPSFRSYVFETAGKRSLLNSNFPATSTCRASTRFQDSLPSRTP